MAKPIYILGTGLSHDGSACLMKNGKIVVAIEKERLTRKKHDGFNDNLAIQYCLDSEGITFKDLELIVEKNTFNKLKPQEVKKRSNRIIPKEIPLITISHHLAHAYSAVGTSPYNEMGVIVLDGQGCSLDNCIEINNNKILPKEIQTISKQEQYKYWEHSSYYNYNGGKLTPIFKDFSKFNAWDREQNPIAPMDMINGIGEFYSGVGDYVFDDHFCEGKLMGLAPYGRPNRFTFKAFDYKENRIFNRYDWIKHFDKSLRGKYECFHQYFQYYADIACWAQKEIEEAIIYTFNSYYDLLPNKNIGYAGGVALNAVVNEKLLKSTKYENFYFQPAAGDNGLAIGCCYYGWLEILKKEKVIHNSSTYFGKIYSDKKIESYLEKLKVEYENKVYNEFEISFYKSNTYIEEAAEMLAEGKVIGWFQDGSEFGPRALGHRSILADPRRKDIRNYINRKIKSREDFRPFAPSVILEDLQKYFDCDFEESPYMILITQTKEEWKDKIPAVVHKDGSARIHTVDKKIAPKYYSLINEFKKITGISVLLNTSFNDRGMPIVETYEEAIDFFLKVKKIDALIIHNFVVKLKNKNKVCEKDLLAAMIE